VLFFCFFALLSSLPITALPINVSIDADAKLIVQF